MTLPWLLMSLLVAAPAPGPVPVQRPMPAPAARPEVMLGKLYDDPKEAITFQPPAGMKQVAVPTVPGAAAEFQDDARKWRLTLTRLQFPAARPLTTPKEGLMVGLLEERTSAWQETPGAEILRSDVYSVGYRTVGHTADTGMIAVRYAAGMADLLGQQAFINVSPSVYYLLELTVPGEHAGAGAEKVSEDERVAAAAFSAMLDTVKLVDRSEVLRDQQERLINTRGLFFASWGPSRLRAAIKPEQWFRIVRDGRDIGYTYEIEEETEKAKHPGINVGVRSRVVDNGGQTDAESFYFVAFDRTYEEWTTTVQVRNAAGKKTISRELGASNRVTRQVLDREGMREGMRNPKDPMSPPMMNVEDYDLSVAYGGAGGGAMGAAGGEGAARPQKLERKLPPYYLPQGLGQILPRIMPLSEIRNYGFARYVPESRLVEMEYVDVRAEQDVTFGGKMVRAVPISDRIGLDGPRTLHYMTRDGDYLGWSNASTKTEVIATEGSALLKLWGNADLSRPAPAPAPAPVPNNMGSGGTGVMPPQPRAPGAR